MSAVEVVVFEPQYARAFAELNYRWIEEYFRVEQHDREILDDPKRWVIDPGGEIFMAVAGGEAVGTVAMIPAGEGVVELTKMAVDPAHQGRGIADELMKACTRWAGQKGYSTIFLESHRSLAPALALYRKHGFIEVPTDPDSLYARADIRIEVPTDPDSLYARADIRMEFAVGERTPAETVR